MPIADRARNSRGQTGPGLRERSEAVRIVHRPRRPRDTRAESFSARYRALHQTFTPAHSLSEQTGDFAQPAPNFATRDDQPAFERNSCPHERRDFVIQGDQFLDRDRRGETPLLVAVSHRPHASSMPMTIVTL